MVCLKQTPAGECIYGLGQRSSTLLERGGQLHTQWATDPVDEHTAITDPFYLAVPVLLALRPGGPSYGVFFNTTWRNSLDLSEPGQMTFRAANAELDYYLIYGPTPAEVLNDLAGLLGGMPMPPRCRRWVISKAAGAIPAGRGAAGGARTAPARPAL